VLARQSREVIGPQKSDARLALSLQKAGCDERAGFDDTSMMDNAHYFCAWSGSERV